MYELKTLKNGITVVSESLKHVRSVSIGIWIKNGSRNENWETNGISHFIEHMLFKGTYKRSAKDIAYEMDAVGGQLNAYTSKDYTCYYTRTLDTHYTTALDIMSDMILNSKFDESEIKKELNVILEEIDMYEDSPEELVSDILQEAVWKDMPLGFPILGTEESIAKFNKSSLKEYYRKSYIPQNTIISVAGNFETEKMIYDIERYFGDWSSNISPLKVKSTSYRQAIVKRQKDIEQLHICFGFKGISAVSDDIFTLNVFNSIFGDGMSSKLFQKIREDNALAYSVYSEMYNYIDDGLFAVYVGMSSEQLDSVFKIIKNEIENIKSGNLLKTDVERAKEQLKSNFIIGLENTNNRMSSIGRTQLLLGYVETPEYIIDKINSIDTNRVLDIADRILDIDSMSISAVGDISELKNF